MKYAFIFPGYGNQFVGMAKEFYDVSRSMQEHFEEAANCLDKNFVKLCFASSDADISQPENAYLSLFLISHSISTILKEQGIEPSVVAGYDIGEYAAVATAGGITLPDAVYLLKKYATLYQEILKARNYEALRIHRTDAEKIKALCAQCASGENVSFISVQEDQEQVIIAGTSESIGCVKAHIQKEQMGVVSAVPLGGGLHSPLMDEVLKTMRMYLEKVDFKDTTIPFIASVTGQALTEGDKVRAAVMQQIHASLQWKKVVDGCAFCEVLVICGPGDGLVDHLKAAYPDKKVYAITTISQMNELLLHADKPLIKKEDQDDSAQ